MKRVLVVDDDAAFRRLLTRVLLRLGFDSVAVGSVPAALRTLGETHVDVILLDVHLKGHTGHTLLRGLDRTGLDLPVVMMSGAGTMQDVVEALRHHAVDWLTKPFEPEELWSALNRAVQHRRRTEARPTGSARASGRGKEEGGRDRDDRREGPDRRERAEKARDRAERAERADRAARAEVERPVDSTPTPGPARALAARDVHDAPVSPDESETEPAYPSEEDDHRLSASELMRALSKLNEQIKDGTIELPPLDPVALELQELFESPAPGIGQVLAVVERDPAVAAAMLRLANSIRFQGGSATSTLKAACIRLGNRRVLSIAQEVMVKELFSGQGEFGDVATAMWENVLVTSQGARLMAERVDDMDPDEVHLAALFHNMGELVLLRVLRTLTEGKQVEDEDLALFATEVVRRHEDVGSLLLKTWGISSDFVRLAGGHHKAPRAPETKDIRQRREVVFAAWKMALHVGFTYLPGQEPEAPQAEIEALGLDWEEIEELFSRSRDWVG